jgi:hypothetical protein
LKSLQQKETSPKAGLSFCACFSSAACTVPGKV